MMAAHRPLCGRTPIRMALVTAAVLVAAVCCLAVPPRAEAATTAQQIKALQKAVRQLKALAADQKAQIASLQAQSAQLAGKDTDLQTQTTKLSGDLSAVLATVSNNGVRLSTSESTIGSLGSQLGSLQTTVAAQGDALEAASPVLALAPYVTVTQDMLNGMKGPNVVFTGVNLHVRDGSGATNCNPGDVDTPGTMTGLGNLIVGYNEMWPGQPLSFRSGSNNLIVGTENSISDAGGLVAGRRNGVGGRYCSVLGGMGNTAEGWYTTVAGGSDGVTTGHSSSVSGGYQNSAVYDNATVGGGWGITARGERLWFGSGTFWSSTP